MLVHDNKLSSQSISSLLSPNSSSDQNVSSLFKPMPPISTTSPYVPSTDSNPDVSKFKIQMALDQVCLDYLVCLAVLKGGGFHPQFEVFGVLSRALVGPLGKPNSLPPSPGKLLQTKLRRILWPCITIHLNFAASSISRVWTNKKLPQTIWYSPDSNTYILGEYDE